MSKRLLEQKTLVPSRFQKGRSGNPTGRKPGIGKIAELRNLIADALPDIIQKVVDSAKRGNLVAARILLDKAIPSVKPQLPALAIELPEGSLLDRANAVLDASLQGRVTPDQAESFMAAASNLARLKESIELEQRLAAIEESARQSGALK